MWMSAFLRSKLTLYLIVDQVSWRNTFVMWVHLMKCHASIYGNTMSDIFYKPYIFVTQFWNREAIALPCTSICHNYYSTSNLEWRWHQIIIPFHSLQLWSHALLQFYVLQLLIKSIYSHLYSSDVTATSKRFDLSVSTLTSLLYLIVFHGDYFS